VRRPGEASDYDAYVDRWYAERPAAALTVSRKIAENTRVDLSDALRDLQSAVADVIQHRNGTPSKFKLTF